jgi:hypothetical protein
MTLHLSHILLTEGRTFIVLPFGADLHIYLHAQPQAPFFPFKSPVTRRRECPLLEGQRSALLVAVSDPASGEIVRRKLNDHLVTRKDSDVVHAHLTRDMRQHLVPILKLHTKHRVGKGLYYRSFELNGIVALRHERLLLTRA